jgi:hypothetical protein
MDKAKRQKEARLGPVFLYHPFAFILLLLYGLVLGAANNPKIDGRNAQHTQ